MIDHRGDDVGSGRMGDCGSPFTANKALTGVPPDLRLMYRPIGMACPISSASIHEAVIVAAPIIAIRRNGGGSISDAEDQQVIVGLESVWKRLVNLEATVNAKP